MIIVQKSFKIINNLQIKKDVVVKLLQIKLIIEIVFFQT